MAMISGPTMDNLVCRVSSVRGGKASTEWRWSDRYNLGLLGRAWVWSPPPFPV